MTTRFRFALFGCLSLLGLFCATLASYAPPVPKDKKEKMSEDGTEEVFASIPPEKVEKNVIWEVRIAKNRVTSSNNLKQIGLAFHSYNDTYNFMPSDIRDKNGNVLLSWRVAILPFIEQDNLYKQFRLNEPWDSDHNLKLLEKMPSVYDCPRVTCKRKGYTVYQGFAGPGSLFDPAKQKINLIQITDGTANTIMAIEASRGIPWTKPQDLPFDPKKDLPPLGKPYDGKPLVAHCDGSVHTLDLKKVTTDTIKKMITTDGGEPIEP